MNRLDKRTVFSILIGLGAVVVLLGIWGWSSRDRDAEKVTILYANKALPAWVPIDSSALAQREIPFKAYEPTAYYTSKTKLIGRRPVVDIQQNQILRPQMFVARDGDISALLPPGTVAYSMALSGSRLRVPNTVSIGDRVDMLAEIRSKIANDTFLITVAEELLIVNIERGTPKDDDSSIERTTREDSFLSNMTSRKKRTGTLVPRAIVLALTREQVQDIELAKSAGADFTLLLRGQAEGTEFTSDRPRTLNEYLRAKGIDPSAQAAAKESATRAPTVTIVRGVDAQEIPIQRTSPK